MKYLILFVFLFTLSCSVNKVKNNPESELNIRLRKLVVPIGKKTVLNLSEMYINLPDEQWEKPVIDLGNLGTFDDNGMMPCSVVRKGKSIMLYYVGWNPRSTVRFSRTLAATPSPSRINPNNKCSVPI